MKVIIVMLAIIVAVATSIVLFPRSAADPGPAPIQHGHDACDRCRMHIGEPGFAGEMRDSSGAFTKYDDIGCLLIAMGKERREAWVEAHDSGALIPLDSATLVADSRIRTPMAYGLIAFEHESAARAFIAQNGGTITDRSRESKP
jgi:copper chaperone NosL